MTQHAISSKDGPRARIARQRPSRLVRPSLTVTSRHVQYEGGINRPQIVWIGGDDMQVPLPRAERNRDIDHIGMARLAEEQADSPRGRGASARTTRRLPPKPTF